MYRREKYELLQQEIMVNHTYKMVHHSEANYTILQKAMVIRPAGQTKDRRTLSDVIIMADTETSKVCENPTIKLKDGTIKYVNVQNHICAWTISIRMNHCNIMTIYGHKPSTMMEAFHNIIENIAGQKTFIYFHNLAYDYIFIRKFLYKKFGHPVHQLNTKPHYPISIEFSNGMVLKDSLILAQRGLQKWAEDMNVYHKKAVGLWNYDKIRNQDYRMNKDELKYIENDTLAGVECIDATIESLKTNLQLLPLTATGIPRTEMRRRAKDNNGRKNFLKQVPSLKVQELLQEAYHGGYTHSNRHRVGYIQNKVLCMDFASSYPYSIMCEKGPVGPFSNVAKGITLKDIQELYMDYCFLVTVTFCFIRLKDDNVPMPSLQYFKARYTVNSILDNGRILAAEVVTITLSEMDLMVILDQYEFYDYIIEDCYQAQKGYLPKWFRDYAYELFEAKTMLKPQGLPNDNPVLYSIKKAELNSLYGMCVQQPIKPNIIEDYDTGEYLTEEFNIEELYEQYVNKRTSLLPYQWGVWVTANSFYRLHQLGKYSTSEADWIYSDTDSCYFSDWDNDKINQFNENIKQSVIKAGYGPVLFNGKEYWPGVAELDGEYTEFCTVGAKRYCCRTKEGKLKITVAGVPKKGVASLNDDINNFKRGFVFDGLTSGKKTHSYIYVDDIFIDDNGNEVGDYVDLTPCDYLLNNTEVFDWQRIMEETMTIPLYSEEEY